MMRNVVWWAVALIAFSFAFDPLAPTLYPLYDYWKSSPSFLLYRIGLVLLLCSGMFRYEKWKGTSPHSPVTLIGRESLLVYTVHLILIYGKFGSFNFSERYGRSFSMLEASIASVLLLVAMYLLAFLWDRVKHGPRMGMRAVQFSVLAGLLAVFFFGSES